VRCGSDRERYARSGIEAYGRSGIVNAAASPTSTAASAASRKRQKRRERDYSERDLNSATAASQAK
jgi:hypothetical protein